MSQAPIAEIAKALPAPLLPDKVTGASYPDHLLVKLAREIAIDHFSIEDILNRNGVNGNGWAHIQKNLRFQQLLTHEISEWQGAVNTHERTKLKAAAVMENWLEEANKKLYDMRETLSAKTEVAKLVARIAGMGLTGAGIEGGSSERVSITINLGADKTVKMEAALPPRSIPSIQEGREVIRGEGEVIEGDYNAN